MKPSAASLFIWIAGNMTQMLSAAETAVKSLQGRILALEQDLVIQDLAPHLACLMCHTTHCLDKGIEDPGCAAMHDQCESDGNKLATAGSQQP